MNSRRYVSGGRGTGCVMETLDARRLLSGGPVDVQSWLHDVNENHDLIGHVTQTADGSVYACGAADFTGHAFVTKYRPDGTPDPAFGGGDGVVFLGIATHRDEARDVDVTPDGKVLVSGDADGDEFLARLNPDGTFDHTFGHAGVIRDLGVRGLFDYSLHVLDDGDILVVTSYPEFAAFPALRVARFDRNGVPRPGFGNGGALEVNLGQPQLILDVAIAPDGKIVIAGSTNPGMMQRAFLVRVTSSGRLDRTFGGTGIVFPEGARVHSGLAIDLEGRILIHDRARGMVRYNADGTRDGTFGTLARVRSSFGRPFIVDDGAGILVAGTETIDDRYVPVLRRLHASGAPDLAFGDNGIVRAHVFAPHGLLPYYVSLVGDSLVMIGNVNLPVPPGNDQTALAFVRFTGDFGELPSHRAGTPARFSAAPIGFDARPDRDDELPLSM